MGGVGSDGGRDHDQGLVAEVLESRALLGESLDFNLQSTLVVAVLNAVVAVPLYHVLDKLRVTT